MNRAVSVSLLQILDTSCDLMCLSVLSNIENTNTFVGQMCVTNLNANDAKVIQHCIDDIQNKVIVM